MCIFTYAELTLVQHALFAKNQQRASEKVLFKAYACDYTWNMQCMHGCIHMIASYHALGVLSPPFHVTDCCIQHFAKKKALVRKCISL